MLRQIVFDSSKLCLPGCNLYLKGEGVGGLEAEPGWWWWGEAEGGLSLHKFGGDETPNQVTAVQCALSDGPELLDTI